MFVSWAEASLKGFFPFLSLLFGLVIVGGGLLQLGVCGADINTLISHCKIIAALYWGDEKSTPPPHIHVCVD